MENWLWLRAEFEEPKRRFTPVTAARPQPLRKPVPPVKILPNITGLRTDEQLSDFLAKHKAETVLVNYGSSWCTHCHHMFPHFISLTKKFPQLCYAVAQVDYMKDATKGITYTPTFVIYKDGQKVDQFFGAHNQQLSDHVWLHSQSTGLRSPTLAKADRDWLNSQR